MTYGAGNGIVKLGACGWPIPGTQDLGTFGFCAGYYYDPMFIPPNNTVPLPPDFNGTYAFRSIYTNRLAPREFWDGCGLLALKTLEAPIDLLSQANLSRGIAPDPSDKNWKLVDMGGSARPGRALWKKQYWESHIIATGNMSTPSPPRYEMPAPSNSVFDPETWPRGNVYDTGIGHFDEHAWMSGVAAAGAWITTWAPQLNTFLNPIIGLWPRCPTYNRYSVLGLDHPRAKYRSIGVTRTTTMEADSVFTSAGDPGGFTVSWELSNPSPDRYLMHTRTDFDYGKYHDGGQTSFDGGDFWADLAHRNSTIAQSNVHIPGVPKFTVTRRLTWGDLFNATDINLHPDPFWYFADSFWGDYFEDNAGLYPGHKIDERNPGDFGVTIPYRSSPGQHGPVFMGRADCLHTIKNSERTCPITLVNNDGNPINGVWTGVDLGPWGAGDVIMIATDTTSRKVWFGINGRWIGPDGGGGDPASGTGFACYMDGPDPNSPLSDTNIDARNYYPCVSCRMGETIVQQVTQTTRMKYPIPKGFKAFAARY